MCPLSSQGGGSFAQVVGYARLHLNVIQDGIIQCNVT